MAKHLATEVKATVKKVLAEKFPEVNFKLKVDRWGRGGSVDAVWIDGPCAKEVDAVIKPLVHSRSSIMVESDRHYSKAFMETVVSRYCEALHIDPPVIHEAEDGRAYIHPHTENNLYRALYGSCVKTAESELETLAYYLCKETGEVYKTQLELKKDYSEGTHEGYAIIGREGYAKMSGPHEWFYIFRVVRRLGPHRVWVTPNTGIGAFRSVERALIPLNNMVSNETIDEGIKRKSIIIGKFNTQRGN